MTTHKAIIVADLGFGDAGKGSVVDFLSRFGNVSAVVRFNGGAQAAHNVVTPDWRHHTFAQFGSGTFVPGMRTHLSRYMLIDPPAMLNEERHLELLGVKNPFSLLTVDAEALVVTPFQKAANRLREVLRGKNRHGSCGMGIGETTHDAMVLPTLAVRARDLLNLKVLERKFQDVQEIKRIEFEKMFTSVANNSLVRNEIVALQDLSAPVRLARHFHDVARRFSVVPEEYLSALAKDGDIVFEGAQGVLLDQWYGFHPYTTWSVTTFTNALTLLREIQYDEQIEKLGVLRAYATRHGPGPFPTENAGLSKILPDFHNGAGAWQKNFRVGWFDAVLARYAIAVSGGIDSLILTNIDRLDAVAHRKIATAYEVQTANACEEVALFKKGNSLHTLKVKKLKQKEVLTDQHYQEKLTNFLEQVKPSYQKAPLKNEVYVREIERQLNVPISIVSYGPTAGHKRYFPTQCTSCVA